MLHLNSSVYVDASLVENMPFLFIPANLLLGGALQEKSTLSCNIVLTAMERAKQGSHALKFLQCMIEQQQQQQGDQERLPRPDRTSFHLTMNALIAEETKSTINNQTRSGKSSNVDAAHNLLGTMEQLSRCYFTNSNHSPRNRHSSTYYSVQPNNSTYDLLVRASSRVGDWDMASLVDTLRYQAVTIKVPPNTTSAAFVDPMLHRSSIRASDKSPLILHWGNEKHGMEKNIKKKYWRIGRYKDPAANLTFTVALQPNRNPAKNGMKILLLSENGDTSTQVGYMLIINSVSEGAAAASTMLGLFLDHSIRKMGVSKVLIAIWLDLCVRAGLTPRTGVIHKPLLAMVLKHNFGFRPRQDEMGDTQKGVLVEISPGSDGSTVELYAPFLKSLQGAFASWDLKRENIRLLLESSERKDVSRGSQAGSW